MDHPGLVFLRRESKSARLRHESELEPVHEHDSSGRRRRRRDEQRVVAPGADSRGGSHRKTAAPVGFEPLEIETLRQRTTLPPDAAPGGTPVDALASNETTPPSIATATPALKAPLAETPPFEAERARKKAAPAAAIIAKKNRAAQPTPTQTRGFVFFEAGSADPYGC
jgi:hypothetical protein